NEWQSSASRELNYNYELYHQLLAYNTYKKSNIPVYIPKICCAYSTPKVLVMEYIKGFKITDYNAIMKYNINMYDIIYNIIDYFAYQIHYDGFFHGDPHPGNILIMIKKNNNKSTGSYIHKVKKKKNIYNYKYTCKNNYNDIYNIKKNKRQKKLSKMQNNKHLYVTNYDYTDVKEYKKKDSFFSEESIETFVDSRYNISKMIEDAANEKTEKLQSFSYNSNKKKKKKEKNITDKVLKHDYSYMFYDNSKVNKKKTGKDLQEIEKEKDKEIEEIEKREQSEKKKFIHEKPLLEHEKKNR
ncbi:protein kinase, putative, partial [Hepatocystis sp. ex Piliocolobus tephrosceles]